LQYPPYKDDRIELNTSGCFAFFNDSKLGITLNVKTPAGLRLAYRLVEAADVLIENMRPGVMRRLALDYETLQRQNPRLIMLSTSNLGQTGPHAAHPGFGSQLSSFSGFTELIGHPDGPPGFLYGPYIDLIAVAYGGVALLAALDRRQRTGQGAYIDLSQYEAGLQFIAPALLDYTANAVTAHRDGNRDPNAVPHAAYPCRDRQWCAISCWSDDEWWRLSGEVGDPALADPRFDTAALRREAENELNDRLARWTAEQEATTLMHRLQQAGVHAGVVNTMRDLFADPQLAERHIWQEQEHPAMGRHHYRMVSYQLSRTPGRIRSAAPCLGEHTEEVFCRWLGLTEQEFHEFRNQGAFS
jgi:benzylsuccinate CoA-transferase BbsF subunit